MHCSRINQAIEKTIPSNNIVKAIYNENSKRMSYKVFDASKEGAAILNNSPFNDYMPEEYKILYKKFKNSEKKNNEQIQ